MQRIEKLQKRKQKLDEKYKKTVNEDKKQKLEEKMEKMDVLEKLQLITFVLGNPSDAEKAKKREDFAKEHVKDSLEEFHAKLIAHENEF